MKNKITQITVNQMLAYCQEQVRRGNGDKYLITADDNDGNGYHGIFYGLTNASDIDDIEDLIYDSQIKDPDKLMCIG